MNRRKRIKSIIFALVTAMVLCTTVFAAPVWKNVSIAYNNLKVNIDGVETILTDLEGRAIEPFIYDGVAYVPLSPLARALGKNAVYDGGAGTIFITTPAVPPPPAPRVTYFFDVLTTYEISGGTRIREKESFKILGNDYTNGWSFFVDRRLEASALYNLSGKYTTIKGVLGRIDGSTQVEGTLFIYLDDKLYAEYPLKPNMLATEVVIDVTGANIMKLTIKGINEAYGAQHYGLGNVTIE